jgi:hypothetical protein
VVLIESIQERPFKIGSNAKARSPAQEKFNQIAAAYTASSVLKVSGWGRKNINGSEGAKNSRRIQPKN